MINRQTPHTALIMQRCRVYIFPCGFNKKPKVRWREQSTNDFAIIKQWEKTDGFIPAIDCGKSNLLVVDVDCHDGSANGFALWDQLVAEHGIPPGTPIVRTQSGGLHVYFSQPENELFGNQEGEFSGRGINVRGDGGYVIAPGATLPDGRCWRYISGSSDVFEVQPPPLPEWIATKIRPKERAPSVPAEYSDAISPYGAVVLKDICAEIAGTAPGNQSNALVRGATRIGSFVGGGEIDETHAINSLIKAGMAMRNGNPSHPWTLEVVEDQVSRAFKAGMQSPSAAPNRHLRLVDLSNVTVGGEPLVFGSAREETRYRLLDAAAVGSLPRLQWIIKGVFPAQGVCGIYGASASGKSFLALSCALAIASGAEWFGYRVNSAFVVYVVLEGEAGFKVRIAALHTTLEKSIPETLRLVINQAFNLTVQNDVADLAAAIVAMSNCKPVVFIDTFNRASPGLDENSSKDMGAILQGLKALQSLTGGVVIFVHHTGKDATKGLRGHSSLFAALDGAIEVSRDGDRRVFRIAKSKDGADGAERSFSLKIVSLGIDEDGDEVTSCITVPENENGGKTGSNHRLKGANRIAFDALTECRNAAIDTPPEILASFPTAGGKPLFRPFVVVPEALWRERCYAKAISTAEQDAKKKAFARARKALLELGMIRACGNYIWIDNWCEQYFCRNE